MTVRAIASIALFIFNYLIILCLAVVLVGLCILAAYTLIAYRFGWFTILLALGLVSMGVLILIFLLKFTFTKHITDRSHLTEVTRIQEPALFSLIEDIVVKVDTDFPKRVYISTDVNASVFYDSSFWSMFLPIKKNLHIGIGLVNTVSVTEFKAILAHEFGHFSQRTMKVGSYVYNVNRIIYNMLYENESYGAMAEKWGNFSSYLTIFVSIAIKVVQGIQWVLKQMYDSLNISYMSLSREMEFHADEVAANVVGSEPLIASLLRMDLADHSYNEVLQYYHTRISDGIKPYNIYPDQTNVINFLATKSKIPLAENLPQVTLSHLSRYNKSKLVVVDQWASHPSTEDRVLRLEKLNRSSESFNQSPASTVFSDINALQVQLTNKLFSEIQYESSETRQTEGKFIEEFKRLYEDGSFDEVYNGYYDNKKPVRIVDHNLDINNVSGPEILFNSEAVDKVNLMLGIERDIDSLRSILNGNYLVKSFDYDGIRYTAEDCTQLIAELERKLSDINGLISGHDETIYQYFISLATKKDKVKELELLYNTFVTIDLDVEERVKTYLSILNSTTFIFETTPFELIKSNLKTLKEVERQFKAEIISLLANPLHEESITMTAREAFDNYLAEQFEYFYDQNYKSSELDILFTAINEYHQALSTIHFKAKKNLLDYQVKLID